MDSAVSLNCETVVMPSKRQPSVTDLTVEELRRLIREEVQSSLKDELGDLNSRLENIEIEMKSLSEFKATISAVEKGISHTSQRMDDFYRHTLPAIAQHIQDVATGLALQTLDLDLDVPRRKWSLTVQGLKGEEGEDEDDTMAACVNLAQQHLGMSDADATDFSSCHRLSRQANSGIIIRFNDPHAGNKWLSNAKNLKTHQESVSITFTHLPPTLRGLKNELLDMRHQMPPAQKIKHHVRSIRQWPYVVLAGLGNKKIAPTISKDIIVKNVLGVSPLIDIKEPTRPRWYTEILGHFNEIWLTLKSLFDAISFYGRFGSINISNVFLIPFKTSAW